MNTSQLTRLGEGSLVRDALNPLRIGRVCPPVHRETNTELPVRWFDGGQWGAQVLEPTANLLVTADLYLYHAAAAESAVTVADESADEAGSQPWKAVPVVHVPSGRGGSLLTIVRRRRPALDQAAVLWHTVAQGEAARSRVPLSELQLEGGYEAPPEREPEPSHIILDHIRRMFEGYGTPPATQVVAESLEEGQPVRLSLRRRTRAQYGSCSFCGDQDDNPDAPMYELKGGQDHSVSVRLCQPCRDLLRTDI